MPHIVLEYSNNIYPTPNIKALFAKIHELLEKELPTQLSSCKSRCVVHDSFYIGDGSIKNAFTHLSIKIMPGRTAEKKQQVLKGVMDIMNEFFQRYEGSMNLQKSVELMDLDVHYLKQSG
jgi:5-carboxymethyl-2-hydroxymuconate isomerase